MGDVYLDLKAKTSEVAIKAAMIEFGVTDLDELSVEVIQEPETGFLGRVTSPGVYRVTKKAAKSRRSKQRRSKGANSRSGETGKQPANRERTAKKSAKNGGGKGDNRPKRPKRAERQVSDDRPEVSIEEQAAITKDFLEGLVEAYGLEGTVSTSIEDDVIIADVSGEQTEALVGIRGSVRSAIHELTRTVLQRYANDSARLRLDIAGYGERRRQALAIYGEQLIEQLKSEGGEIMLEPMSPADRKVIHDVASAHEGVTSYSEGEPPRRYVVLSAVSGGEEE
ncbi:MAG: R3H domain-containing nucleic acid-binding protein [Acidimicrobiia bacterium]|nr:R3H domain-containing nucleic acid-binding protein [Acidimicrobiia bacterium]